jgi:ATP-dependent RNA helicase DeaD
MPPPILAMTQAYQDNPIRVKVQPRQEEIAQITQFVIEVYPHAKLAAVVQLMRQIDSKLALVFCNTKHGVDDLTNHLQKAGLSVDGLHGGKSQDLRERILNRFKRGQIHILVATDVAARGIDVPNVEAVINFDLPKETETYTHRIGRTGRAGQSGRAYSLVTGKQKVLLRQLQKNPNNTLEPYYLDEASAIRGEAPEQFQQQQNHRPSGPGSAGGPNQQQAAKKRNRPRRHRGAGGGPKPPSSQGQSQQSS